MTSFPQAVQLCSRWQNEWRNDFKTRVIWAISPLTVLVRGPASNDFAFPAIRTSPMQVAELKIPKFQPAVQLAGTRSNFVWEQMRWQWSSVVKTNSSQIFRSLSWPYYFQLPNHGMKSILPGQKSVSSDLVLERTAVLSIISSKLCLTRIISLC